MTTPDDYSGELPTGPKRRLVLRPQAPRRMRNRIAIVAGLVVGVALLTVAVLGTGDALADAGMAIAGTLALAVAAVAMAATRR